MRLLIAAISTLLLLSEAHALDWNREPNAVFRDLSAHDAWKCIERESTGTGPKDELRCEFNALDSSGQEGNLEISVLKSAWGGDWIREFSVFLTPFSAIRNDALIEKYSSFGDFPSKAVPLNQRFRTPSDAVNFCLNRGAREGDKCTYDERDQADGGESFSIHVQGIGSAENFVLGLFVDTGKDRTCALDPACRTQYGLDKFAGGSQASPPASPTPPPAPVTPEPMAPANPQEAKVQTLRSLDPSNPFTLVYPDTLEQFPSSGSAVALRGQQIDFQAFLTIKSASGARSAAEAQARFHAGDATTAHRRTYADFALNGPRGIIQLPAGPAFLYQGAMTGSGAQRLRYVQAELYDGDRRYELAFYVTENEFEKARSSIRFVLANFAPHNNGRCCATKPASLP